MVVGAIIPALTGAASRGLTGISGLGGIGAGLAGGIGYGFGLRYGFEHLFPAFDRSGNPLDAVSVAVQDIDQLLNGTLSGMAEVLGFDSSQEQPSQQILEQEQQGPIPDQSDRPNFIDDLSDDDPADTGGPTMYGPFRVTYTGKYGTEEWDEYYFNSRQEWEYTMRSKYITAEENRGNWREGASLEVLFQLNQQYKKEFKRWFDPD